jgi:hypothetical protein
MTVHVRTGVGIGDAESWSRRMLYKVWRRSSPIGYKLPRVRVIMEQQT